MRTSFNTILTIIALSHYAYASSGDRASEFTQCVNLCHGQRCGVQQADGLPLALRLTRWTCTEDCKYHCMHEITDRGIQLGKPVQQYYGKWPFWRLAGMQEPASVVFSVLNLWAHVRGASKVWRRISENHSIRSHYVLGPTVVWSIFNMKAWRRVSEHQPMRSYYLLCATFVWSMISINAWIWSSVFHTRDLPLTEKLDYFSAALVIIYALYYTIIRLFHLYPTPQTNRLTLSPKPSKIPKHKILFLTCTLLFIAHVSYLSLLPRFDYTYNMAFNITLGLLHNALWSIYSLPPSIQILRRFPSRPKSYRPKFVSKAGVFVILTTGATALELFDFSPWARTVDAHSLWHLSTAPIALMWYDFLLEDILDPSWREHQA